MNFFEVTILVLIIGFIAMELTIIFIISLEKSVEEQTKNWTLVRFCNDKLSWSIKRLVIDVVLFIGWVYSVTYCHWYDPGFWR